MIKSKLPAERRISFEKGEESKVIMQVPTLQTLYGLFGTDDKRLSVGLLSQAIVAVGPSEEGTYDLITAIIEDFAPRDSVERLMAVQMAATHTSVMAVCTKMNAVESLQAYEVYERSFNKLARTFTAQVEALRKHRNGGRSKVTVEHVTVNEGGQAIVGNVEGGHDNVKTRQ